MLNNISMPGMINIAVAILLIYLIVSTFRRNAAENKADGRCAGRNRQIQSKVN